MLLEESLSFPGFYKPPLKLTKEILVSRTGEILDPRTGEVKSTRTNHKGYLIADIKLMGVWRQWGVHRIVAITFIQRPDHLLDIPFHELQVNHKNGIKTVNDDWNLEWCTNAENMKHARDTGLFDNELVVLARSINDGIIIKFKSVSDCARSFLVSPAAVSFNINGPAAGRVEHSGFVFKLDDGLPWPTNLMHPGNKGLARALKIIGVNESLGKKILSNTLNEACRYLGVSRVAVNNNRARYGNLKPTDGWVFYPLTDYVDMYGVIE